MGKSKGSSARGTHPGSHVERERKFDVPAHAVTPSFDGLASIARVERLADQTLEAVYYDTARHDLSARRITLRRRTGGPDEGWHVKLPGSAADPEARTEIRAPLQPEVPDALRDVVLAIVRDRPLVPVARIHNRRTVTALVGADGAPVAEFCDDRVSACGLDPDGAPVNEQGWREWELELSPPAEADPTTAALLDRLTNRVLDAGGTPAGHASKLAKALDTGTAVGHEPPADPVHRAVAGQIERLLETDRAVREDADDAVHQMRVATRQIRSLLQASGEAFGVPADSWVLAELRELAAVLGVARDAEVLGDRYRTALSALPAHLVRGPVVERLVDGARRRYQSGLRRSLTAMRSDRYFRLLDALDELAASTPPPAPATEVPTVSRLASSYRKVRKAARRAEQAGHAEQAVQAGQTEAPDQAGSPSDHDHAVHQIRKAAKRLRYVAEATGHTDIEKRAKAIQTLLGDHQDSVVSREHLLARADEAHTAGEDTFTYGVLYQQEADLALRCEEQLPAALEALRRSARSGT